MQGSGFISISYQWRHPRPVLDLAAQLSANPDPDLILHSLLCFQDLIEMLVRLQGTVEGQGKKVADLEDYIDALLIRVMDTAPVLLEKNIIFMKNRKPD